MCSSINLRRNTYSNLPYLLNSLSKVQLKPTDGASTSSRTQIVVTQAIMWYYGILCCTIDSTVHTFYLGVLGMWLVV